MRIGDVAIKTGLSAKSIRFYEEIGLIRPAGRSAANYRSYDGQAMAELEFIRHARDLDFTLDEVRVLLKLWRNHERPSAEVKQVALDHLAAIDRKIAALTAMRLTLARVTESCQGNAQPDCAILDGLAQGHFCGKGGETPPV